MNPAAEREFTRARISAGTIGVACAIVMLWPSEVIRAGHSGQIARMLASHCSIIPRNRRGREYSTVPI